MLKNKAGVGTVLGLVAAGALAVGVTQVQADSHGGQIGMLTCKTVPGTRSNLIIRSTVDVECTYSQDDADEMYVGETGIGLGIDLNIKKDATMKYAVFAHVKPNAGSGALSGRFGGVKGAATVGIGVGAAVLVGGGANQISLQPLALEGSTGFGVEGGATYLYLQKK